MTAMASSTKPRQFLATIYKIWTLRYVDVPAEIGRALAREYARRGSAARRVKGERGKFIPVVAMVNGRSTRTTLTPAGGGGYRLQFNATLRKVARADVGEVAGVTIALDRASRELPVPPDLAVALKRRSVYRKQFDALPPGLRMQLLRYLQAAKGPATRQKCIVRFLEILLERALLRKPTARKRRSNSQNRGPGRCAGARQYITIP